MILSPLLTRLARVQHPEKKGLVRVEGYNSYICLDQDGDTTIMYIVYVTAIDLKMALPTWVRVLLFVFFDF
jgi:hypothetical protein